MNILDNKYKRIILVGRAASGKDHTRKILEELGMNYAISYTTRPKRNHEIDGIDYNFLSENDFIQKISEDFWYEYIMFNGWYYGSANNQINDINCNLFIMTPAGISLLKENDRKESLIIYININKDIIIKRLYERNDRNDTIKRRLKSDDNDFLKFTDFDIEINNSNFDKEYIIELIKKYIKTK